jgi:hypothetical protein
MPEPTCSPGLDGPDANPHTEQQDSRRDFLRGGLAVAGTLAADFEITPVVDGNWGVHAVIKKSLFAGEPA